MAKVNLQIGWIRTMLKFVVLAVMVVVIAQLFPRKSVSFDYQYAQDKPWQYDLLTAPFDFHVYTMRYDTVTLRNVRVDVGVVQKGEKIITSGEKVDADTYCVLESLKAAIAKQGVLQHQAMWSRLATWVFIILFVSMIGVYLHVFRPQLYDDQRPWLLFALLITSVVVLACSVVRFSSLSIYLVPFAWVPIICRVFYDSRTAMFMHTLTVMICSFVAPQPFEFIVLQMMAGMVAVSWMKDMTQRSHLAQTAVVTSLTYALCYTAFVLFAKEDPFQLEWQMYVYFAINGLLLVFAYGLIYVLEKLFSLVSSITLVELTNMNSDLMIEFAERAPGTFQHSLQVSSLAMAAAKRVGANALLVRTGGLYHDIGKLVHPENFTENQSGGNNPLMQMTSIEAARVVIQHVAEGVKLAKKHNLPDVVIQLIRSHHGTSKTRFFYNTYVNEHPGEEVDESLFMYPGPRPMTKEMAILMMADAVEARSHSLKECTPETIREMVDQMVGAQFADGQFESTPLTFRDVEEIKEVFCMKLASMNHQRIAYPELKK